MKLLVQPGDGVTALVNAIHRAETTIEIAVFRFDFAAVEKALTAAVKRGVSVHALIAHVNSSSADALRKLELRLLAAGATVARTNTDLARYHSKYMIVDRRELFVLAFNFTHQDIEKSRSFGLITKNRDLVHEAVKLFSADVKRKTYKAGLPNLVVSPVNARKQIAAFIKGAKSELAIYDPRVSDPAMIRLLQERMEAGVNVRIIGRSADKDRKLPVRALTSMRLHTRTIVRDRKAVLIGSQSLRQLELDGRRELGILCRDRAVVNRVLEVFEEDWPAAQESKVQVEDIHPVAKVAKRVAKAVTTELPEIAPVLDGIAKEIAPQVAAVGIEAQEVEESVRAAVKDAVRAVLQEVIEQRLNDAAAIPGP